MSSTVADTQVAVANHFKVC